MTSFKVFCTLKILDEPFFAILYKFLLGLSTGLSCLWSFYALICLFWLNLRYDSYEAFFVFVLSTVALFRLMRPFWSCLTSCNLVLPFVALFSLLWPCFAFCNLVLPFVVCLVLFAF